MHNQNWQSDGVKRIYVVQTRFIVDRCVFSNASVEQITLKNTGKLRNIRLGGRMYSVGCMQLGKGDHNLLQNLLVLISWVCLLCHAWANAKWDDAASDCAYHYILTAYELTSLYQTHAWESGISQWSGTVENLDCWYDGLYIWSQLNEMSGLHYYGYRPSQLRNSTCIHCVHPTQTCPSCPCFVWWCNLEQFAHLV